MLIMAAGAGAAADWSKPVEVCEEPPGCVSYRARLDGDLLVIQAMHQPGWHTNAMDNKRRAEEKLAGKQSLGVDAPTEITVTQGLQTSGAWLQSPPKDASKPDLLWYTWVFEKEALFVSKVRRNGTGPAVIGIRGQACTETTCKKIDLTLSLPLAGSAPNPNIDLKSLIPVRN